MKRGTNDDNDNDKDRSVAQEALEIAVLTLSPIIPHVTHALWRGLGFRTALIDDLQSNCVLRH